MLPEEYRWLLQYNIPNSFEYWSKVEKEIPEHEYIRVLYSAISSLHLVACTDGFLSTMGHSIAWLQERTPPGHAWEDWFDAWGVWSRYIRKEIQRTLVIGEHGDLATEPMIRITRLRETYARMERCLQMLWAIRHRQLKALKKHAPHITPARLELIAFRVTQEALEDVMENYRALAHTKIIANEADILCVLNFYSSLALFAMARFMLSEHSSGGFVSNVSLKRIVQSLTSVPFQENRILLLSSLHQNMDAWIGLNGALWKDKVSDWGDEVSSTSSPLCKILRTPDERLFMMNLWVIPLTIFGVTRFEVVQLEETERRKRRVQDLLDGFRTAAAVLDHIYNIKLRGVPFLIENILALALSHFVSLALWIADRFIHTLSDVRNPNDIYRDKDVKRTLNMLAEMAQRYDIPDPQKIRVIDAAKAMTITTYGKPVASLQNLCESVQKLRKADSGHKCRKLEKLLDDIEKAYSQREKLLKELENEQTSAEKIAEIQGNLKRLDVSIAEHIAQYLRIFWKLLFEDAEIPHKTSEQRRETYEDHAKKIVRLLEQADKLWDSPEEALKDYVQTFPQEFGPLEALGLLTEEDKERFRKYFEAPESLGQWLKDHPEWVEAFGIQDS